MCNKKQFDCKVKLHIHHIDSNKNNCNNYNLISLCPSCHSKTRWYDNLKEDLLLKAEENENRNSEKEKDFMAQRFPNHDLIIS